MVGGLDRAGVETWLINVLRRADRARFQMDFLVHGTQPYAYEREAADLGAHVIRCLHPHNAPSYGASLYRVLSGKPRYDIVHGHVHFLAGFVLRIARLAGVPHRIAHSHLDTSLIDAKAGIARRFQVGMAKRWLDSAATRWLAVSTNAAAALFAGAKCESQCGILPCGVDLAPFRGKVDKAAMKSQLGVPPTAWVVGHVGRLEPQKNHAMLVRIAAEITKRDPQVHFLFVGEGRLRPAIEALVKEAGCCDRVHLLGSRADAPKLMRCMDAFVFPSLYEGLPLVAIEAQAAGLECFVSDNLPRAADIVPDSVHRLALADGPSHWAEQILRALTPSAERCAGQKALSAVEQSIFNIENNVEHLLAFYQSL